MHHKQTCAVALALSTFIGACGGKTASPSAPSRVTTPPASPSQPSPPRSQTAVSLTISGVTTLSGKGETGRLSALVMYDDGNVQDHTTTTRWSSANEAVATINAEGTLTAVGEGQTTVTAVFDNMSAAKNIRVDLP